MPPVNVKSANLVTVKMEICEETQEALRACRGCLATDARLFPLHANALAEAYGHLHGEPVSRTDGLPQFLCSWCCRLLQNYTNFKTRSNAAQNYLRSIQAQNNQQQITTEFIKNLDTAQLQYNIRRTLTQNINIASTIPSQLAALEEKTWDIGICNADNDPVEISDEEFKDKIKPDPEDCKTDDTRVKLEKRKSRIKTEPKPKPIEQKTRIRKRTRPPPKEKKPTPVKEKKIARRYIKSVEDKNVVDAYLKELSSEYNCEVVMLTKEQQIAEIEARKETDNYKKSKFKCEQCFKGFNLRATFEKHMLCHDPEIARFECEVCHHRHKSKHQLSKHYHIHKYNFMCKQCSYVSKTTSQANSHFNFHKGRKYECEQCGKVFDKITTKYSHIRIHHGSVRCEICGEMFINDKGLYMHMTKAHKDALQSRCAACKLQFHSMDALNKHLDALPDRACDDTVRACAQCGQNCGTDALLRAHAQEHHSLDYNCDVCYKVFKTEWALSTHVCGDKRGGGVAKKPARRGPAKTTHEVMCEVCGAKKPNPFFLKEHMLIHTGEKPHQCTLCPKRYRLATWLQYHMNVHNGTRPYKCPRCPKAFFNPAARHTHRLVHKKGERYLCPLCGKAFRNTYMRVHFRTAHLNEPWPKRVRGRAKARNHKDTEDSE